MAFGAVSGYGNLSSGNFSSVIYSKKVQLAFRKSTVAGDITNSDYFGEIANQGDTVRIIKEPEISVSAYLRGTTIAPQDLSDDDFSLVVDKANYFALTKVTLVTSQHLVLMTTQFQLLHVFQAQQLCQLSMSHQQCWLLVWVVCLINKVLTKQVVGL